jgi:hypothetical protein
VSKLALTNFFIFLHLAPTLPGLRLCDKLNVRSQSLFIHRYDVSTLVIKRLRVRTERRSDASSLFGRVYSIRRADDVQRPNTGV